MKKVIAFDGPTACGKTTLLEKVYSELIREGIMADVMTERNTIRDLIDKLQMGNIIRSGLPPLTESLFWTMNQAYRVETELPEKEGEVVLIDRYIYTPITFQYLFLRGEGATLEDVSDYISKPFGIPLPLPDLSIILTAPIDTLKQRFKKREKRRMSKSEQELTEQALDVYKDLEKRFKNYYVINSNRSVNEIYEETQELIKKCRIRDGTKK